jgi:Holliday junction DNA helicase RuvA
MMLSSLTSDEIRQAILSENIARIKSVKGIGLKSAQRLVLELKDKIVKGEGAESTALFKTDNSALVDEATTALTMLGFSKANIGKVMPAILKENPNARVEDLIKAALKRL